MFVDKKGTTLKSPEESVLQITVRWFLMEL